MIPSCNHSRAAHLSPAIKDTSEETKSHKTKQKGKQPMVTKYVFSTIRKYPSKQVEKSEAY